MMLYYTDFIFTLGLTGEVTLPLERNLKYLFFDMIEVHGV